MENLHGLSNFFTKDKSRIFPKNEETIFILDILIFKRGSEYSSSLTFKLISFGFFFFSSSIRFDSRRIGPLNPFDFTIEKEEKLVGSISASKWGREEEEGGWGWMKFSRIVIERRRIDVPRARGEKIGNQRVLEYCQRCKIDCIFVEIFSFSPERTRLETRWNFLRRMPPRRNCRSVLENRSKFRRGPRKRCSS